MSAKAQQANSGGALAAAVQAGRGGFRDGVTPSTATPEVAGRVGSLMAGGFSEFQRLYTKTQFEGAAWTAKDELKKDAEYVTDADSTLGTIMRAGQSGGQLVGVMLTITLAAAIGFVGTKVTSEIDSSIDTKQGTAYDNASNSIGNGFADAMGLTDIVFLVLMFGVILGALLAFRGQR